MTFAQVLFKVPWDTLSKDMLHLVILLPSHKIYKRGDSNEDSGQCHLKAYMKIHHKFSEYENLDILAGTVQ